MNQLPADTIAIIASYLTYPEYVNICLIDRYCYEVIYNNTIFGKILQLNRSNLTSAKEIFYYCISLNEKMVAKDLYSQNLFRINIIDDVLNSKLANSNFDIIRNVLEIKGVDLSDLNFVKENIYSDCVQKILKFIHCENIDGDSFFIFKKCDEFIEFCSKNHIFNSICDLKIMKLAHILGYKINMKKEFMRCCSYGHLEAAQWLYTLGGIGKNIVKDAYIKCNKEGEDTICNWLVSLGFYDVAVLNNCVRNSFIDDHMKYIGF
jgi:hypothetical protein